MLKMTKRSFFVALACGAVVLTTFPAWAGKKTEDQLIADLSSPKESVVDSAMLHLEKEYPTSTKATTEIKKYLGDHRPKVRRKAARVLGALHADVTSAELKSICELLKAADHHEICDGLIALRGLKAKETLPQITPLLNSVQPNVVRDACRTIAVLGDKSHIPLIEPLLKNKDASVQKDAQDAIYTLKTKS